MLGSQKVSYEVGGNIDATCFGGIAAVHRLVTRLGLVDQINEGLHLLKMNLPYHESDHVLNLAYNVVCGPRPPVPVPRRRPRPPTPRRPARPAHG
jgi:hypothetical protein